MPKQHGQTTINGVWLKSCGRGWGWTHSHHVGIWDYVRIFPTPFLFTCSDDLRVVCSTTRTYTRGSYTHWLITNKVYLSSRLWNRPVFLKFDLRFNLPTNTKHVKFSLFLNECYVTKNTAVALDEKRKIVTLKQWRRQEKKTVKNVNWQKPRYVKR